MRITTALLTVLVLITASCGSSTSGAPDTQADGRPQSFEDINFESPLSDYLGFGFGDNEDAEAEFAEMEREAQRIIAECMIDEGFEYQPMVNDQFVSFGPSGDELPYFSDAWVEKYGFGITTQRFAQSSVGELVGYADRDFDDEPEFVDPNREYVEALSEGERNAYETAMNGEPADFEAMQDSDEAFLFEPSGCQGEAYDQVYSQGPGGGGQEFFEAFGDQLQAMGERAEADPRVIEFRAEVSECVAAAGETWIDQEALYERFQSRLDEIQPGGFGPDSGDPFEAAGVDPEEMSDREMEEFFRDFDRIDPADLPALAALQEEELALAKTVVGCGGGPLNEAWVLRDIQVEYEQEFIDQNAEALADFKTEE